MPLAARRLSQPQSPLGFHMCIDSIHLQLVTRKGPSGTGTSHD